jgi:hypothetical protein
MHDNYKIVATYLSQGRAMRRTGMQFTLRLIMVVVAVAGFIFAGLAWFLQSQAPDAHVHDAFIQIGPYLFWFTSPASRGTIGWVHRGYRPHDEGDRTPNHP